MKETSSQPPTHEFELASAPFHPLAPPCPPCFNVVYLDRFFLRLRAPTCSTLSSGGKGGTNTCRQHEFGLRNCFLQPSRVSLPQPLLDRSACTIKVVSHTQICFVPATMDRVGDEQPPRMSDDEKRLARKWWHEGKTRRRGRTSRWHDSGYGMFGQ